MIKCIDDALFIRRPGFGRPALACVIMAFLVAPSAPAWPRDGDKAVPTSALVIELIVEARDTIPMRSTDRHGGGPHLPAVFEDGALTIDPAVTRALRRREFGPALRVDDAVEELADAAIVVVERRHYRSAMRRGDLVILWLHRALAPFPAGDPPGSVLIAPFGSEPPLREVIGWPAVTWRVDETEDDKPVLVLETLSGAEQLAAGEATTFDDVVWELPLRLGRFAPVPVGQTPEQLEPVEVDYGEATFTTRVTVRFHGRLELRATE